MRVLRLGIAGLGQGGKRIVPAALRSENVRITAVAEPRADVRAAFQRDVPCEPHETIESLAASDEVDLVYVATPTHLHAHHVLTALSGGKHVIVEKPMAVTLADATAMVDAAQAAGLALIVGHSQSFEPPIRAMRDIVRSSEIGPLRMLHTLAYTDWLYRPRTPEELDTNLGGGTVFRQAAHQVDLLRWIGGGMVRSVRASAGAWDASRPTEGAHTLFLEFVDGTVATAVYSGYDHLPGSELTFGITEEGRTAANDLPLSRIGRGGRGVRGRDEAQRKASLAYSGASVTEPAHAGFFGLTIISCERGDTRQIPEGLRVYGDDRTWDVPIPRLPDGRDALLREAYGAVVHGRPPPHDGRWGRATLEVCLAALESSRTRREVALHNQVPTRD